MISSVQAYCLHTAGEEHDANGGTNGRRRKVVAELAADGAAGTVGTAHLAPHDTETRPVLALLDLDEGSVGLLVGQRPPEAGHDALHVETAALLDGLLLGSSSGNLLLGLREELLNV